MKRSLRSRHGLLLAALPLLWLTGCATTPKPIEVRSVMVQVPVYVALPSDLTTFEPMPAFPADFTNDAWVTYTMALQTALKIDIDKLTKIQAIQPPGH